MPPANQKAQTTCPRWRSGCHVRLRPPCPPLHTDPGPRFQRNQHAPKEDHREQERRNRGLHYVSSFIVSTRAMPFAPGRQFRPTNTESVRSSLPRVLPPSGHIVEISAILDVGTIVVAELNRLMPV